MTFVVRPMVPGDIDAAVKLAAAASDAPQWNTSIYAKMLKAGESAVRYFAWSALAADAIIGFAIASWLSAEEPAELETLVVDPRFRRHGVGTALLRACLLAATQAGARTIRLEVRESNTAALALYQRYSFTPTGRRRAYYAAPVEDAILLKAHLGPSGLQSPL